MFYYCKEKEFINIFNICFQSQVSHGSHRWFINRINRKDVFRCRPTESDSLVLGSRTWVSVSQLRVQKSRPLVYVNRVECPIHFLSFSA